MRPALFLKHKIDIQLQKNGKTFVVERASKDKYGQPLEPQAVFEFVGLYHEKNSFVQTVVSDATVTQTEKMPTILCMMEDARQLQSGDVIRMNDNAFTVSGIVNVQELDVVADVSLNEVK